jgi:predicted  nucleic acid-binding Zn-ribbon protein
VTAEQRFNALERSAVQHDKQIKAIRDLVQQGMQLVLETRRDIRETRKDLRTLAASVHELTNSLRRGST